MAIRSQLAEAQGPTCIGAPRTVSSLFADAVLKYPNNTAVASLYQHPVPALTSSTESVKENLVWTYRQLDEAADLLATAFYTGGIRKGMQIAAFLSNTAEWALLFWTSIRLGTIFVPLDARSVPRSEEVQHYLKVVRPAVLVLGDDTAVETLQRNNASDLTGPLLKVVASSDGPVQDGWVSHHDMLSDGLKLERRIEQGQMDTLNNVVLIIFTS